MSQDICIVIDGIVFDEVRGLESFTVSYRDVDSDGDKALSFSSTLEFYGAAFNYLKEKLICEEYGYAQALEISIIDKCCNTIIVQGIIKGSELDICDTSEGQCFIQTNVVVFDEDTKKRKCLESTLIWDGTSTKYNTTPTEFESKTEFVNVQYCDELRPNWLHHIILILAALAFMTVNTLMAALLPVILLLWLITGNNIYTDFRDLIGEFVTGCGRKHPTPLLRDYIKNACKICGLEFKSSILNDPASEYFNTLYFNAPSRKGVKNPNGLIPENRPNETGAELLDRIKCTHNANWKIKNGCLFYERKDKIDRLGPVLFNLNELGDDLLKLCFTDFEVVKASGNFKYNKDERDFVGDEALPFPRYNDRVEWNPNGSNPYLEGTHDNVCQLGASRYRDDGIEQDVLDTTLYNLGIFPWSSTISQNKNVLLLANGTAQLPKLIIWDGLDRQCGRIIHRDSQVANNVTDEDYNWPYWFNAKRSDGLYQRFHYIDSPYSKELPRRSFVAEIKATCERVEKLDPCGQLEMTFCGELKTGVIDLITYSRKENKITFYGRI